MCLGTWFPRPFQPSQLSASSCSGSSHSHLQMHENRIGHHTRHGRSVSHTSVCLSAYLVRCQKQACSNLCHVCLSCCHFRKAGVTVIEWLPASNFQSFSTARPFQVSVLSRSRHWLKFLKYLMFSGQMLAVRGSRWLGCRLSRAVGRLSLETDLGSSLPRVKSTTLTE